MDYTEYLLNEYVVEFAPVTSTEQFQQGITLAATVFTGLSFGALISAYFGDSAFIQYIPTIKAEYKLKVYDVVNPQIEALKTSMNAAGQAWVANLLDSFWITINSWVDFVFNWLGGTFKVQEDTTTA